MEHGVVSYFHWLLALASDAYTPAYTPASGGRGSARGAGCPGVPALGSAKSVPFLQKPPSQIAGTPRMVGILEKQNSLANRVTFSRFRASRIRSDLLFKTSNLFDRLAREQ
jgi:hypothetical protein